MKTETEYHDEKHSAQAWFRELRDQICSRFEFLERKQVTGPFAGEMPGRFSYRRTRRRSGNDSNEGGGEMAIMRDGRLFEKVGVNISTVYGTLGKAASQAIGTRHGEPDLRPDTQFWASGVSLVAHMQSPKVPGVHLNTRMFCLPGKWWFGGGTDLNPCIPFAEDTHYFHRGLQECCDRHGHDNYEEYSRWAEKYFYLPHRKKQRGVGGIFFDDHNTGDWHTDFAFVQDVGVTFLGLFTELLYRRRNQNWTSEDRQRQLVYRGHYVEFNLICDRGTRFGLNSGHDPEAVLMSLPPVAAWP